MADGNSVSFMNGGAPKGAPQAQAQTAKQSGAAPASARSVIDILGTMSSATKLSKDGEAYFASIVDNMTRSGREPKTYQITGSNYEARVMEYNGWISGFIFAETYVAGVPPFPAASVKDDLGDQLAKQGVTGTPLILQVVNREDYVRVDNMSTIVLNAYKAKDEKAVQDFTAAAFSGGNYGITDDMTYIRPFVEALNPTAVLPRMDVGLMLYGTKPKENAFNVQGKQEVEMIPVLAVTGYTDFVYFEDQQMNGIGSNEPKFVPVFHITGIFSKLPSESIAAVGVALTSFLYIRKGRWLKQFSSFKPGEPDIGNLLQEKSTGKPATTKDMNERNQVINGFLVTKMPMLVVDIQLGNYFIPGLNDMIEDVAKWNAAIDKFTGGDGAARVGQPVQHEDHHFDGRLQYGKAAEYVDTRCVDYISLVSSGIGCSEAAAFLCSSTIPAYRSTELKKIYPQAEMTFITFCEYINPDWIDAVCMDLAKTLHVHIDGGVDASNYNIGALRGFQALGMNMMPGFATNSGFGGFHGSFGWM